MEHELRKVALIRRAASNQSDAKNTTREAFQKFYKKNNFDPFFLIFIRVKIHSIAFYENLFPAFFLFYSSFLLF